MRILLATAVAIAPLMVASGALAQVTISTARTTPVVTSTVGPGNTADSVIIAAGGSVAVNSGVAVTVNSNNNFTINSGGSVTMADSASGSTGLLVNGGVTSNITIGGSISVTDNNTNTDADGDGDADGPFATGTGRYGVRVAGAGDLTGNIQINANGLVLVEGNNSFGISLESGLHGDLISYGTVRVIGDNSVGVQALGDIDGDVYLGGTVLTQGQNASAIVFNGDVSGRLAIAGSVSSTGYRYETRPFDSVVAGLEPDDLYQNRSAVVIAGNVGGGVVFDTAPTENNANSTDDDGDGIPDASEGSARINSFGAAPAVTVGSATQSITLGVAGTGTNNFGFINRGQITGQGIYDGIAGNGVQFGVAGGQTVTINGGISNEGTILTVGLEAASRAVVLGAGVTTPQFVNSGSLTAAAGSQTAVEVTAVRIEAGASLPTFTNSGNLLATAGGGVANVTGILDLSGTLTSITNTRSFQVALAQNEDGDPVTGTGRAIDVRANTTGVTVLQTGVPHAPQSGDPDTDGDGVSDAYEPIMIGDILLGTGADVVDIRNGVYVGDISFNDGADTLSISGGGLVQGALSDNDGVLDIGVSNGTLDARHTAPITISNLNVGADGKLIVTLDPNGGGTSGFNVTGTATLADGAGLGVRFTSLIDGPQRFTIIDAGTLNYGAIDLDAVQDNSPFLFVVDAGADLAAGQVYVDTRRRTAAEAELFTVEAAAYDAFYDALDRDDAMLNVFLSQTTREGFIDLYEQLLPDHSGGPLMSLASGVDAVTRALTGRNASAAPGETSAWLQEINFYADKERTDTYGFRSEGFGVAGGIERGTDYGALGLSVAFTSSDLEDPESEAEEVLSASLLELGLYWRAQGQYWTTWARAAAGYASFDATRQFVGGGLNLKNESSWNGYTLAAAGGASYERSFGRVTIRPEVYAEYFSLSEEARSEAGGGDSFDLDIDERDGHMFSATAAMNISLAMGENDWLRPEIRFGWRQNISVDPGDTIARYVSGGPDFILNPDSIEGGGPIAGFRLNIGNELGMLSITGDAEMIEDYVRYMLMLRASFRF